MLKQFTEKILRGHFCWSFQIEVMARAKARRQTGMG